MAPQKLHGKDADISREAAEIQDYILTLDRLPKAKLLDLFQRRYLRSVTIAVGLMVFQQLGAINGVCFYVSNIFEQAGFSSSVGTITYAILQVLNLYCDRSFNFYPLKHLDAATFLASNLPKTSCKALDVTPRTGSAVAGYCPIWAWLHSHQPERFCFWELTKQLPRVVTHPGIAPASNSLNFGVPTNPKPVSSQKASHYIDARCAI
ncbi:hypothetical protein L3X38_018572 [Prunus dulcis]|uniref:Uncharacterized protein n=1 Tax=Prunus dulcis TaxID=3755 RepID=A0AAD4W9A5_PRUDU|nr:hypothetical protein L3X38_018572 [Prunus dulcis]